MPSLYDLHQQFVDRSTNRLMPMALLLLMTIGINLLAKVL